MVKELTLSAGRNRKFAAQIPRDDKVLIMVSVFRKIYGTDFIFKQLHSVLSSMLSSMDAAS